MSDNSQKLNTNDLSGIYSNIAEVIDIDATLLLHSSFQGQQITFPKKLYTKDFIIRELQHNTLNSTNKKKSKDSSKSTKEKKQTTTLTEKQALKILSLNNEKAKKLLKDKDSMDILLKDVDDKFNKVTGIKEKLEYIPLIISLIRSYISGEYRKIPTGSLIGLISALIYFLSPVNIIPDFIPFIGQIDDMILLGIAVKLAYIDLEDYKEWRDNKEH